jgi:hypothetical protein
MIFYYLNDVLLCKLGGPGWSWKRQEHDRCLQSWCAGGLAWLVALGWASASHRSLTQMMAVRNAYSELLSVYGNN